MISPYIISALRTDKRRLLLFPFKSIFDWLVCIVIHILPFLRQPPNLLFSMAVPCHLLYT